MTEPTTTQLKAKLAELGIGVEIYRQPMKSVTGHEYLIWRCDLKKKRRKWSGYGIAPKSAILSSMFEALLSLIK